VRRHCQSRFRTIQVCPQDKPARLLQAEDAVVRPLGGGRMVNLRRREFIALIGGATAWPFAARAQQGERIRRIGVLQAISESDPEAHLRKAAFVGGLQKLGWTEGTNVTIDYRWAGDDADRIRLYVTEITAMRPDVIWTSGALPLLPLKRATRPFRSSSRRSTIQSAAGSLRASLDREATSLDSRWVNSPWAGRSSRCSRRWHPR